MEHNVLGNSTSTKPILDIRNAILKGANGSKITTGKVSLYGTLSCNTKVQNYKYISNKEDEEQYHIFHDTNNFFYEKNYNCKMVSSGFELETLTQIMKNHKKGYEKNTKRNKKILNCFM